MLAWRGRQFLGAQRPSQHGAKNTLKEEVKTLYVNLCIFGYYTDLFYQLKKQERKWSPVGRGMLHSATERQSTPKDGS